ncbi:aspartate 1-decarboxylase [Vulgatibacter incomptus]|uniref:Aspartate 1-decarboxylase n=1 Tax=Vulgatibacter incomptus TaxID=1391653 RepID=A0A0K1P9G6_9BACT|nr:aspartate 1-decarboxylase [Vulgatibacter incomptus]AKU89729.1 Aspartate 1-decarboxylase [Vulgatibacter incomptus]
MRRQVFKSKLHRVKVTQADVDYEGSVTVDEDLLDAADIREFEAVHIWNVTNGSRLVTYALKGPRGSRIVCVNGAAAHLNHPGDRVILATFADLDDAELTTFKPKVVLVDDENRIKDPDATEVPGPLRRVS